MLSSTKLSMFIAVQTRKGEIMNSLCTSLAKTLVQLLSATWCVQFCGSSYDFVQRLHLTLNVPSKTLMVKYSPVSLATSCLYLHSQQFFFEQQTILPG